MESVTQSSGVVEMRTRAQRLVATGKPDIWLVGAVHIGTRAYYTAIQSLLDSQGEVLYEGVKPKKDEHRVAKVSATGGKPIYKVLSDAIGLDFQLSDIDYSHPGWKDVDLSWDRIAELNQKASNGKPNQVDTITSLLDPNSPTVKLFSSVLSSATPGTREAIKLVMVKLVAGGGGPGLDPGANQIVVVERNKAVLAQIRSELASPNPPHSIGVFYGALHLPGMETALSEAYGYREADQKWFTSATADPSKLDAMGKQLYEGLEKIASKSAAPVGSGKP